MENHIDEREFLFQFFGNWGRELGTKNKFDKIGQWYTDNPNDMLNLIEEAKRRRKPAYLSIQPRYAHDQILGLEKLFFDFDFAHKGEKLTAKQETKKRKELEVEVRRFLKYTNDDLNYNTLNFKTRRGYHVYLFINKILQMDMKDFDVWKLTYELLQNYVMNGKYEYCDKMLIGNIKGLARLPFSEHEKSGEKIIVVDKRLEPTKIRSLSYYTEFGLKVEDVKRKYDEAVELIKIDQEKKTKEMNNIQQRKEQGLLTINDIRPCFKQRLEKGEMPHQMRLACLLEGFHSGRTTEEELVQLFSTLKDYDGWNTSKEASVTRYQVGWFFENKRYTYLPYTCDTIKEKGWCLGEECKLFKGENK